MEITTVARQVVAGARLEALELRPGSELAVRVHEAPPAGGRGVISLAGLLLSAQLPAGLVPGQRLAVRVLDPGRNEVLLQVQTEGEEPAQNPGQLARAAGALATTGDGQLVQIAVGLQTNGLALLPNGDALTLVVQPDEGDGEQGGGEDSEPEASFVLHSALLGPIEVRLRLASGGVGVEVAVEPAAEAVTRAAAPQLRAALERATGAPASVAVEARASAGERPAPPRIEDVFDAYA